MKNKLKMFATCIPVRGAAQSIICDVQRSTYSHVPNSLVDFINKYDGMDLDNIYSQFDERNLMIAKSYVAFLIKNEFAFFTDTPSYFPNINLDWDTPHYISNAIIDVEEQSTHNYSDIIRQLSELKCQALEIRTYGEMNIEQLIKIVSSTQNSSIRSVNLLLKYSVVTSVENLNLLYELNSPLVSITLYSFKGKALEGINKLVFVTEENFINESDCGKIDKFNFTVNLQMFTESKNFNSCLNRKVSIDREGNVKNCPSCALSYGNIKNSELSNVINQKTFTDLWMVKKDDIDVCKDCEYRYICVDCRAYTEGESINGKPSKCNYDPYTAKWL